jgi:hypothetical protein
MLRQAFGTEERAFRLLVEHWRGVEKTCNAGLFEIAGRLLPLVGLIKLGPDAYPGGLQAALMGGHLGTARIDDIREPILLGLIGGGMTSTEAGALVRNVFDETLKTGKGTVLEFAPLAFEIVQQAIAGLQDEPLGETTGPGTTTEPAPNPSKTARRASQASSRPSPA